MMKLLAPVVVALRAQSRLVFAVRPFSGPLAPMGMRWRDKAGMVRNMSQGDAR